MKNASIWTLALLLTAGTVSGNARAQEQERFVYDDAGKRDPFWPLVEAGGNIRTYDSEFLISDLTLEGIMYSPDNKGAAIINGRVVKADDVIGQYRVVRVDEDSVTLLKGDERYELRLKKGE